MNTAGRPHLSVAGMAADDLLAALNDWEILETLEITKDDLLVARKDSDLLETLRITYELLAQFRASGVLSTFLLLPRSDQANFLRWIGMTDDRELRRDRTRTLALALEDSPLAPDMSSSGSSHPSRWAPPPG